MSENSRVILDIAKTCRTCLSEKSAEELKSLLENDLKTTISEVTNVQLDLSSSLPQYICSECLKYLNVALNFRKQVYNAESQLRSLVLNEQPKQMTVIYKSFTVLDNGVISEDCIANIGEIIDPQNNIKENVLIVENLETDTQVAKDNSEGKTIKRFLKDNESIYAITEEIDDNSDSVNYFVANDEDCSNNVHNETGSVHLSKSAIVLNATLTNVIKWAESESSSVSLATNFGELNQDVKIGKVELVEAQESKVSLEANQNSKDKREGIETKTNIKPEEVHFAKLINFSCDLCSKKFRFEFIYKKHRLKHGMPLSCELCLQCFYDANLYLSHIKSDHSDHKAFACPSCEERFFTLTSLKTHFKYHTINRPKKFGCDICGKRFFQHNSLTIHKKSHTSLEPYKCEICHKKLSGSHSLRNHLKIHKGERKHKCNMCGATFIHRFSLRTHIRTHTGEKPFACKLCHNKFSTSSYLKIHVRTHTAEKPYACLSCPKSFVSRGSLAAHEKSHTGEKKFQCDICGWRSSRSADLQTHIRKHTGEKPYNCDQCGKSYKTASNLSAHRKTHTGLKEHICNICTKAFGDPRSLKSHIRIHTGETPYLCHICGRRFKQSGQLSAHRKIHQNRETIDNT